MDPRRHGSCHHRLRTAQTEQSRGIGRHQDEVIEWVLKRKGNAVRTGLEDNIRIDRERLAASNAELVRVAAGLCASQGFRPATPAEARAILGLPAGLTG